MEMDEYLKLLNDKSDNKFKRADAIRKCIVFASSTTSMDDVLVSQMLSKHLNDYSNITENGEIYDDMIKKILEQTKASNNSFQWRNNLQNIDLVSKLPKEKPLLDKNQVTIFQKAFTKKDIVTPGTSKVFSSGKDSNSKFSHHKEVEPPRNYCSRFPNQNERDKIQPNKNYHSKLNNRNETEKEDESKKPFDTFKTARDELNLQNVKKHGSSAKQIPPPQKRRIGLSRTVSKKFISPLQSNNDGKHDFSAESELPVDERLKNIEAKMVELIKSEIMDCGTVVTWNDIAGLEFAKTAIQEAVVWPMLRPDIFTGLRRPPKGILLFGPPGTGKTLIGKCVASQSKSTFFSISASSLTSKWIGDGEKMVRALFAVARCHQPAVIFIDEIDSLLSQRSETEHDSSRRIKTEFLVQLDGVTTEKEEQLLVIGATNRPQELDEAARRRFVKRLYIPLPEYNARVQLVDRLMATEKHNLTPENVAEISKLTDGYSGADMRNLCSDACLGPIRSINMSQIENIEVGQVRPVTMDDFRKSISRVRSSVSSKDLDQYLVWDSTYGSGSF